MYFKLIKKVLLLGFVVSLTACANFNKPTTAENFEAKEKLYESTKNYGGLISLYRDSLKTNDDPNVRYKLANSYHIKGDYKSSMLYLTPLLDLQSPLAVQASVLQVKNLIQLKQYSQAVSAADAVLQRDPRNAEAYNLRGIAFAHLGRLSEAQNDLVKAREFFLNDVAAINNMAMLNIISGDYRNAVDLLLPQYLNGVKDQRLIHNLVFALVKNNDTDYALDIIRKERLSTSPEDLVSALKKAEKITAHK
ncbi:tetratricopeptide repeat protein [Lonepinella sp. MS14437]|uniref:tetratricopeptide repeat protein n=1 Tax=unclassified Lonepinella TaxID=2642006 RepID=UPI0036DA2302